MNYSSKRYRKLIIQSEPTHVVLRCFDEDSNRELTCHVIAASPKKARVVDANGKMHVSYFKDIEAWLKDAGFEEYCYGRNGEDEKLYRLDK